MKKMIVMVAIAGAAASVLAGPHGCHRPCGPGWGHRPPPPPHHHYGWGRGGCNFWPGFIGGMIGGAVANAIVEPSPVVVTTPVVTTPVVTTPVVTTPVVVQPTAVQAVTQTQNVWVEGRYVDQVQANGTVVRVWQPGHYEQRAVAL